MLKVSDIAKLLGETYQGEDIHVSGVSELDEADETSIVFLSDASMDRDAKVGLLISNFEPERIRYKAWINVKDVKLAMVKVLELYDWHAEVGEEGISEHAFVHESASIGEGTRIMYGAYIGKHANIGRNVRIFPFVYVGEYAVIGDGSIIYPHVYIGERVILGRNVIVHSGARIGADGFGYVNTKQGHLKIPQIGTVVVEDDVEIGANTTIDRATIGRTIVGKGTKIDNLVQIAHNVKIGRNCIIVAQTGIGGSTKIGDNVILAGQVGVADHTIIENNVIVTAKTGVSGKLKANGIYSSGIPQMDRKTYLRVVAILKKLPEMYELLRKIRAHLRF